jgi:hypothetical protein
MKFIDSLKGYWGGERFYIQLLKEEKAYEKLLSLAQKNSLSMPAMAWLRPIVHVYPDQVFTIISGHAENFLNNNTGRKYYRQGNASVHIADIHIAVDGLQGQKAPEKVKTFRASSLKLIWYLLQKQESLNKSYREIAAGSGVSLDTISKTLRALEKQNFYIAVKKGDYKLVNKKSLLEKWLINFEDTLKPKLNITRCRFADKKMSDNWKNILLDSNRILWGGEPAAAKLTNYLVPEMFTIYTDLTEKELLKHYRLIPDKTGNIEVYQLFFNSREFDCTDIVPPLLIYADLQSSGEERNMETAERIYEEYLADIIQ